MAKTITITFDDTQYTLEYTKKSIERMEDVGFVIQDARTKPMTTLPTLFAGAFQAHHKWLKQETIDKIYAQLTDKEGLVQKLIEMYTEQVEALFDEPEPSEKNAVWEATF